VAGERANNSSVLLKMYRVYRVYEKGVQSRSVIASTFLNQDSMSTLLVTECLDNSLPRACTVCAILHCVCDSALCVRFCTVGVILHRVCDSAPCV
jgi:hypothetical protein